MYHANLRLSLLHPDYLGLMVMAFYFILLYFYHPTPRLSMVLLCLLPPSHMETFGNSVAQPSLVHLTVSHISATLMSLLSFGYFLTLNLMNKTISMVTSCFQVFFNILKLYLNIFVFADIKVIL